MSSDAADVKRQLQGRMLDLCHVLLPGGKKRGHEYRAASLAGGDGQSVGVHLAGTKAGTWAEFNGGQSGGDIFDLIGTVRGCSFVQALAWAREYLGIPVEPSGLLTPARRAYKRPSRPANVRALKPASPVMAYLTGERGLSADVLRLFQVADGVIPHGEFAGKPAIVFPYKRGGDLVMVKWLALERVPALGREPKKIVTTTADSEPCCFGWQAVPDSCREIVIAEGEIDAMTWADAGFPAVAPPRGTASTDWIDHDWPMFERFETVYVHADADEPGQKWTATVASRFGERARIVGHLPVDRYGKDANAHLTAGATREDFAGLLARSRDNRPAELAAPIDYASQVAEIFDPQPTTRLGSEPPFGRIAGRVQYRPGEVSVWTGYNHHGKSELLNYCVVSALYQGERAALASLEVLPRRTLARLVRQSTGERQPSPARQRQALEWLTGKLWLWDSTGRADLDRILEVFAYARRRYDVTQIVIDNLAMLGIGEDDYNRQREVMQRLCEFTREHNAHAHLVAHPRKGSDENMPPGKLDVRGGGVLTDLAHNVFVVWRNVAKGEKLSRLEAEADPGREIPAIVEAEPDGIFAVRKQRETGDLPIVRLWFDRGSLQYHEQAWPRPFCWIDTPEVVAQADALRADDNPNEQPFQQWEDSGDLPF